MLWYVMPQNSKPVRGLTSPLEVHLPYAVALQVELLAQFLYLSPENLITEVLMREMRHYNFDQISTTIRQRELVDNQWNQSAKPQTRKKRKLGS
jgi:hypothetical protein